MFDFEGGRHDWGVYLKGLGFPKGVGFHAFPPHPRHRLEQLGWSYPFMSVANSSSG